MRRTKRLNTIIRLTLIVMLAAQIPVAVVAAETANAPSLVISQLKITSSNGQFITLYNATNTPLDMGMYQLEYFNNYDLAKATSSKLISLTGTVPPVTVISQPAGTASSVLSTALPASDVGLMSPMITEILPNPAGTGNDSTDEFIEVYNPNPTSFDLSNFGLQSGITSLHNFAFPSGATLKAQGFTAFYSATTGLSLSNTSGQVKLLSPAGNVLSSTAAYSKAADGQAWALANGKWDWTTKLTPGAPNVIAGPAAKAKKSTSSKTKSKSSSGKSQAALASSSTSSGGDTPSSTPIHASALAVVAGLALIYGAYEYRADLANRLYQLKRNLGAGPGFGPAIARWRGHRIGQRPWRRQNHFRKGLG